MASKRITKAIKRELARAGTVARGAPGIGGGGGGTGPQGPAGEGVPVGGTTNQVLAKASNADYDTAWVAAGSGSGDVVGPASSTDNAVVRFDGTTGKLVQDSGVTIDDTGRIGLGLTPTYLVDGVSTDGNLFRFDRSGVQIGAFISSANAFFGTLSNDALRFITNSVERVQIDASGNVGIGVTPSANDTAGNLFFKNNAQVSYSGPVGYFDANCTYSSAADRYIINGLASRYAQVNGVHYWYTAATGTAGNAITFTERMRIDASGNVTIADLAGSGTRMVTASSTGELATQAIPTSNATHTGDVTGDTALTIANDAVTYAKFQNASAGNVVLTRAASTSGDYGETALAASQLLGRGATGDIAAIALGSGLSMSGTTLSASSPDGYTVIVKSATQDVTNLGVTNDNDFSFATAANGAYLVTMDLVVGGNNATGDFTMDFQVAAGTMKGRGNCQNLTSADAIQNIIVTAAAAANTTAIVTGTPADLDTPIAVRVTYAFTCTNATTFRFRFGNAAAASGRTSRVWKGSIMKYKSLL